MTVGATETEGMQTEGKAAVIPKPDVGGRLASKTEFASLANPSQWMTIARNPDISFAAVNYSSQREQLRSSLETKGEILPQTHEFSQLVQRASEKLGIPGETEVVTVDTEEMIAFFNPRSRTVVLSRGFARHLQEGLPKAGIQFSEDHIAAVIAHELKHAEVLGDDYVKKLDESFWERLKASFSHAEEYRADAEGMRRLARAKYNPNAMIEIFKSFSLTMGRGDISHPEIIDRIRKLEDELADDEHPIPNTSKDRQVITDPNLLNWISQDSEIYKTTETVIAKPMEDIDQMLMQSKSQKEFWDIQILKEHVERVGVAKGAIVEQQELYDRIAKKVVICKALCQHTYIVDGKEERIELREDQSWYTQEKELGYRPEGDIPSRDIASTWTEMIRAEEALMEANASYEFRGLIKPITLPTDTVRAQAVLLQDFERFLDHVCQDGFALLVTQNISAPERKFLEETASCYRTNQITENVMRTAYLKLDKTRNQQEYQERAEEDRASGRRDRADFTELSIDFTDSHIRNQIIDQIKVGIAVDCIGDFYQPNEKIINQLASLISKETGLPPNLASSTAKSYMSLSYGRWRTDDEWTNVLAQRNKDLYLRALNAFDQLDFGDGIKLSPRRSIHKALSVSIGSKPDELGGITAQIKEMLGQEIYDMAVTEPLDGIMQKELGSPRATVVRYNNVNLPLEDWLILSKVDNKQFAELRAIGFIYCYIKQIEAGQTPDQRLTAELGKIREWPKWSKKYVIPATDMELLMKNPPWPPDQLKELVDGYLDCQDVHNFSKFTDEELDSLVRIIRVVGGKKTYQNWNPDLESNVSFEFLSRFFSQNLQQGQSYQEALVKAIISVADKDINLGELQRFGQIWLDHDRRVDVGECFSDMTDAQIEQILSYLNKSPTIRQRQTGFYESLLFYAQIPFDERKTFKDEELNESNLDKSFEDRNQGWKVGDLEIGLQAVINKYQDQAVEWVVSNFPSSINREKYLLSLYELASEELKTNYIEKMPAYLVFSPDEGDDTKHSSTNYDDYLIKKRSIKSEDWQRIFPAWRGLGRVGENFDDLLKRRHSFATSRSLSGRNSSDYGSIRQRFQAQRLLWVENTLFDNKYSLEERVTELQRVAASPSVVRDIHLEMMLEAALNTAKTPQERVIAGKTLLPLFTPDSGLRNHLAAIVFSSELSLRPELHKDFNEFTNLLLYYLPKASLQRNHFLNNFENTARLSPEQLQVLDSLRISSEGKKDKQDSSPMVFVIDKIGEQNREDKIATTLWLLGLSNEKSKAILGIERNFDGHLNGLPQTVAVSTGVEREVLFKRLFLGAEGVLDLEAVPLEQAEQARNQRKEFIGALAAEFLPEDMPNVALFRDIFTSVLESSDPPHASRTLVKLLNSFIDAQAGGKKLPPEEVIAISLNELGVVGKKVSQSLAELDWVPDSYRKTLRRSQSEGETVPKRALMVLAEDAGLLDPTSPIRIISFDDLIGAASNKQACLLTVEVTDESVGLPKGSYQVVGKFKRPSAQKKENIEHDLRVMRQIIEVLNQRGYAESLPRDFSAQISDAVNKELDFTREKQFSDQLRADLAERNSKRRQQVSIPKIYFTSEDVMLESVAPGISLRAYRDLREQGADQLITSGYGALSGQVINQTIVTEALSQLITTGNIHADLHPGNIFVDQQGNLIFIDLGMHQNLTTEQRFATISLVAGLASGNEAYLKNTLKNMGWDLGNNALGLTRFNFAENTLRLLRASQKASTQPPEMLTSVILATSKLSTYTSGFSSSELFRMLLGSLNKRETPRIAAHLVRSGLGIFLRPS
ncbi:MAG: AarF/UbiB family protein [Candidatus Daviesbacteria bacterium]|nr:AarF/UbiB family protein [Candidatus Daviesbacteria bacterium]